ncbi:hypothetical protein [Phenylobacterium sp.]|jgi:hypothetical protein|uniref:hypothetical protein n=1 Tax=Phenylobacterium sp. TaxID=1871053 RepID=UPI000C937F84|nr:hypothetical protein [Phenylobacterium sp.]MAK81921.1 hypothetical protein [Phenylobacterium sp.]|tara:strand:+ start:23694 stop:24128 length:435 start_codon:yes stop_codon:yes gene_type:complete
MTSDIFRALVRSAAVIPLCALALAACGEADLGQVGRNAAWAAVEAANPELSQGLRAAQTLRQAAATCGWADVDAGALARIGVAGIEEPMLRAAAESLADDLLSAPASSGATANISDCSPETRRALEARITAMAGGEEAGEAEGG